MDSVSFSLNCCLFGEDPVMLTDKDYRLCCVSLSEECTNFAEQ